MGEKRGYVIEESGSENPYDQPTKHTVYFVGF